MKDVYKIIINNVIVAISHLAILILSVAVFGIMDVWPGIIPYSPRYSTLINILAIIIFTDLYLFTGLILIKTEKYYLNILSVCLLLYLTILQIPIYGLSSNHWSTTTVAIAYPYLPLLGLLRKIGYWDLVFIRILPMLPTMYMFLGLIWKDNKNKIQYIIIMTIINIILQTLLFWYGSKITY